MNKEKVIKILQENNASVKKQFGQNFLLDENVLNNIVKSSGIDSNTFVVEIGPGLGFLTEYLSKNANNVLCYEIDTEMVNVIKSKNFHNVDIIEGDFLKANIDEDFKKYSKDLDIVVVANLPYYITTPILLKILEETKMVSKMVVMMQKEVALRLCGRPSTKDYNSLSVLMQYYTDCKLAIKVGAKSFYPEPNVDSAVVLVKYKKEITYPALNEEYFKKFNRIVFAQRRKTLVNNLKSGFGYPKELIEEILTKNNISLTIRTEALSVDEIVKLSNEFYLALK